MTTWERYMAGVRIVGTEHAKIKTARELARLLRQARAALADRRTK